MLLPLLVSVALTAVYLRIFVWRFNESSGAPGTASRPKRAAVRTATSVALVTQPPSLEGVLLAQLGSGEITRWQYLQAMERLAARDAERHPLVVPPDITPPSTSAGS